MTPPRPANAALLAMALACAAITGRPVSAADAATWSGSLKQVFADRCVACHGALAQQAGLRVDTAAGLLAGGDAGPVVVPGDPAAGTLVARLVHALSAPVDTLASNWALIVMASLA